MMMKKEERSRGAELRAGALVMLGLAIATAITTWSSVHSLDAARTEEDVARLHPLVWAVNGMGGPHGVIGCGAIFATLFLVMAVAGYVGARRARI